MKQIQTISLKDFTIGGGAPLVLIAGPCVIEDEAATRAIAAFLKELTTALEIPLVFKASYDKANRTSIQSYRGPGIAKGLEILGKIKEDFHLPVISDVHRFEEIDHACAVLDIVQIPAFLCRQTDFVVEVARHARIVNVKKGQFMAPWDVRMVVEKITAAGNEQIMVTERGVTFGYNNLVADMRALPLLRTMGRPVIFDSTHSVQLPGGAGIASAGDREMAAYLSRAAVATGVDGIFLEVHPAPDTALCDGPNSIALSTLPPLLNMLKKIDRIVKEGEETI